MAHSDRHVESFAPNEPLETFWEGRDRQEYVARTYIGSSLRTVPVETQAEDQDQEYRLGITEEGELIAEHVLHGFDVEEESVYEEQFLDELPDEVRRIADELLANAGGAD